MVILTIEKPYRRGLKGGGPLFLPTKSKLYKIGILTTMLFVIPVKMGATLRAYDKEGNPYEPIEKITNLAIIRELVTYRQAAGAYKEENIEPREGILCVTLPSGAEIMCGPADDAAIIYVTASKKNNILYNVTARLLMPGGLTSYGVEYEDITMAPNNREYGLLAGDVAQLEFLFKAKLEKIRFTAGYKFWFSETRLGCIIPAPMYLSNATRFIDLGEKLSPIAMRGKLWICPP